MASKVIFASTQDSDMRYAVKTPITSSFFYVETKGKKYAFLDKVDFGTICPSKGLTLGNSPTSSRGRKRSNLETIPLEPLAKEARKLKFQTSNRNKLAYYIFKKYKLLGREVEVPIHFPLDMADFLRKKGAKLVPTFPFFPERAVKTEEEIEYIKECLAHTRLAFRIIENILRTSEISARGRFAFGEKIYYKNKVLTSEFLKQEAEKALIEKGMFDLLGMIISTGEQTAVPHHDGTGPIHPHRPVVCDIFPRHRKSGYFADMTRTFVKGKPSPEIQKMYAAVLKAQLAAMKKIRAGMSAKEIYDVATDIISKEGYDVGEKGFIHGLGHGVGLDIHEKPSLKPHSEDVLEAGNVITIEPGLYYPKVGGIRIEDMVLVTKTGCKNLTNYPKKLIIP
ncbi:MAG: Xaa-Pro peptidase family protein [Candidatus Moranbacteria bacterium]|nr:Xaa-Pro peptidase family protein [Candidatus Moranbacteria bacterium]